MFTSTYARHLLIKRNVWLETKNLSSIIYWLIEAVLVTCSAAGIHMCVVLFLQAATRCDSMTLTPGQWLGLPAVTAVTLYRHEDPALVGTDEEFSVFNSQLQPCSIISFFEEESFCCIFECFLRFPLSFFFSSFLSVSGCRFDIKPAGG